MRAVRVHPKLSATCLGLALTLGSLWWSAASTYVVLHDGARFVGALAQTLVLPHLLAYGQSRATDTQQGALVTPLLSAGSARAAAVAVPVAVIAGLLAAGFGALQVILLRRRSSDGGSIESES